MGLLSNHGVFERHSLLLTVAVLIVVSIGGLVQLAPLAYLENTIEPVEGVRPYTPLELAGRNIYVREGCYVCHSQMVRPLRDEVERYGHYSIAAESIYDRPFQWGSKRSGPDLARLGGKYSDEWHVRHMINPRAVVPESVMPPYAFLAVKDLNYDRLPLDLKTNATLGVPYTEDMLENAMVDLKAQLDPYSPDLDGLQARYPGAQARDFDGNPDRLSELDALIAYMQVLGTMVDFSTFEADAPENLR
ncbi:MAG: cytochrome-c oxidase, cbb3-type subunit II [Maricaulaceae bacterium]